MYVVHSSNIPEEFDLRKAPTGTAGTLRLDELHGSTETAQIGVSMYANANTDRDKNSLVRFEDDEVISPWKSAGIECIESEERSQDHFDSLSNSEEERIERNSIVISGRKSIIPLVSMRPSSNTDSWYILNLLQAVPFLTRYVTTKYIYSVVLHEFVTFHSLL